MPNPRRHLQQSRDAVSDDNTSVKLSVVIPVSILIYLVSASFYGVRWGSQMDLRMSSVETNHEEQDKRIEMMDTNGTRRLAIVEDRQARATMQLAELRMLLDRQEAELRDLRRLIPQPPTP